MLRGTRWVGMVAGLGLFGCNALAPGDPGSTVEAPIIGGQPDPASRSVVGILVNQVELCSGSLLAPNLVLTARHCVSDSGSETIQCGVNMFGPKYAPRVFVVTTDADINTNGVTPTYGVTEVRTPEPTSVCGNDVAVLILDTNIPTSTAVPLIPRLDDRPVANESFDAIGYGVQNPDDDVGATAGVRMRANGNAVLCVGASACRGTDATNSEWVAEAPICSGDSGGPALDSQGRVIGVASRSNVDCSAGLYEAVDSWKSLIVEAALDAADQGGYEPPAWTDTVDPGGGTGGTGGSSGTTSGGNGGRSGSAGNGGSGTTAGKGGTGGSSGAATSGGNAGTTAAGNAGTNTAGRAGNSAAGSAGTNTAGGAGVSTAGGAGTSSGTLGDPCSGASTCAIGYRCYAADDKPPGVCLAACPTPDTICPSGYECSTRLGICREKTPDNKDEGGCGCRTAPASAPLDRGWGILALAGIFAGTLRRRRRRPH